MFSRWYSVDQPAIVSSSVLPKRTKDLSLFWDDCVADDDTPFCCHVDSFSRSLRKRYTHKLKAKHPGQSEKGAAQSITQYKGNTEDLSGDPLFSLRPLSSQQRLSITLTTCSGS